MIAKCASDFTGGGGGFLPHKIFDLKGVKHVNLNNKGWRYTFMKSRDRMYNDLGEGMNSEVIRIFKNIYYICIYN